MSTQLDLSFAAPVGASCPSTSKEAAAKVDVRGQFHLVLRLLAAHPEGLTDDTIAERLSLLRNSAGTRRGRARDLGLVEDCGRSVNERGNAATVWRLSEAGREYVERLR